MTLPKLGVILPIAGIAALAMLAGPLAAQYPDDGRVEQPARMILAAAYDSTNERGWCVTDWHLADDGFVVVTGVIPSASVRASGWNYIIFDCPTGQPLLHTHPPAWPFPSPTDVREGLIDRRDVPFIVVQSARDHFAFQIARRSP